MLPCAAAFTAEYEKFSWLSFNIFTLKAEPGENEAVNLTVLSMLPGVNEKSPSVGT
jgi:hypothetical protein